MDLNSFRTNTPDALPLLHFILHTADLVSTNRNAFMQFLHKVITNPNPLFKANPSDGLDCTLQSSSGQNAGEMFPNQAVLVLCWGCEMGDMRVVKGMMAAGTNVNQCDENYLSPLMYASQAGNIDVIHTLVSHGAHVNLINSKRKNCLLLACENKEWKAAIALYQYFDSESHKIYSQLSYEEQYKLLSRHDLVKLYCERRFSIIDRAFVTALGYHGVAYTQHVASIDPGAHAILIHAVSLSDACRYGYDLVIKHHARHKYLTQNNIIEAVKVACASNQLVVLPILLPYLNSTSVSTLIAHAYQQGYYQFGNELFELCKEQSTLPCPDVSITDACKANNMDLVKFLIKHGNDVTAAADQLGFMLKYMPTDKTTVMRAVLGHVEPDPVTTAEEGSKANVVIKDHADNKGCKDRTAAGEDIVTANENSTIADGNSTAMCKDSTTTWEDSTAAGKDNMAAGKDSMAADKNSMAASGKNTFTVKDSMAAVQDSMTTGEDNTVAGEDNIIADKGSTAAGEDNTVKGKNNMAAGENHTAEGKGIMAVGEDNTAEGKGSMAAGEDHTAEGKGSMAAGEDHTAEGKGIMAVGEDNTISNKTSMIVCEDTTTTGKDSITTVEESTAVDEDSETTGIDSISVSDNSTAVIEERIAASKHSTSAGENSMASREDSTTAGEDHTAAGEDITTTGKDSISASENSAAAGENSTITGEASTAEGEGSTAASEDSTTTGTDSMATNGDSTAAGEDSTTGEIDSMDAGEDDTASVEDGITTFMDSMSAGEDSTTAGKESTTACEDSSTTVKDRMITDEAAGKHSTTTGSDSMATDEDSAAAGKDSTTTGKDSISASEDSTNANENSTITGSDSIAAGEDSTTTGIDSIAAGEGNAAVVEDSTTTGKESIAACEDSTTTVKDSIATDEDNAVAGENSTTIASDNMATAEDSTAAGEDSTTGGIGNMAAGEDGTGGVEESITTFTDRTPAGEVSTTVGKNSLAASEDSTAAGKDSTTASKESTAAFEDSTTTVKDSMSTDEDNTVAGKNITTTGSDSMATGEDNAASGEDSTTTGKGSIFTGEDSIGAGEDSPTTGIDGITTGEDNTAVDEDSTTTGKDSMATGKDNMATDENSTTTSDYSTITGNDSTASGEDSTTTDKDSISASEDNTAAGKESITAGKESTAACEDSSTTVKDSMISDEAAGKHSTTTGSDSMAADEDSTATGEDITTTGKDSVSASEDSTDTNENSSITGSDSIAAGKDSTITSIDSIAAGEDNAAVVEDSTTTGKDSTAACEDSTTTVKDSMATDEDSTAASEDSTTTGIDSTATGEYNVAVDEDSTITGKDSMVTDEDSTTTVEDKDSISASEDSAAACEDSTTTGKDSISASEDITDANENSTSTGSDSIAAGEDSTTTGIDSIAAGEDNAAIVEDSTTTGKESTAACEDSTTTVKDSMATDEDSTAASEDITTTGIDSTATGEYNVAVDEDITITGKDSMVTDEDSTTTVENKDSISASENSAAACEDSTTTGKDSISASEDSAAACEDSTTTGKDSISASEDITDANENSTITGSDSIAAGEDSTTTGIDCIATGEDNIAVVEDSTATGKDSAAEGEDNTTTGKNCISASKDSTDLGENSTFTGKASTAESEDSTAAGEDSTTIGRDSLATDEDSTVGGEDSKTTHIGSKAAGEDSTVANEDCPTIRKDSMAAGEDSTTTCKDSMDTCTDSDAADEDSAVAGEDNTVADEDSTVSGKCTMTFGDGNTTSGETNNASSENIKAGKDNNVGKDLIDGDSIKDDEESTFDGSINQTRGSRNPDDDSEHDTYGWDIVIASLNEQNDHNCHPPLVYACMQGNNAVVKLLLQHGADINIHSDETPLTAACKHGHRETVDILLCNAPTPSISERNMYGMTPLQVAVKHHHGTIAKMLIKKYDADPNECRASGSQFIDVTLHVLRKRMTSFSIVKESSVWQYIVNTVPESEIHRRGWRLYADVIDTAEAATPPIVTAFRSKQYELVKFFIDQNIQYKPLFELASLQEICQLESVPLVHEFIHSDVEETHMNYQSAFEVAVKLNSVELMSYFISHFEEDTRTLANAIIHACEVGSEHMVRLLIQHDKQLVKAVQHESRVTCHSPLCISIRNYDVAMTKMLHKCGAQLFNDAPTEETLPHHTLCQASLRELCSRQDEFSDILPPLLPDHISQSSLNHGLVAACKAGCTRAARLFLDRAAYVNCCDDKGMTPLHAGIYAQSSEVVALLLAAGADPEKSCTLLLVEEDNPCTSYSKCKTPLNSACELEHCEIATKLINAGANTNPGSLSPLLTACKHNYLDIVQLLLDNKADPNHTSSEGHILLVTHRAKHYEAARLLLEYGTYPGILILHECLDLKSACELGYTEVAQRIVQESQDQVPRDLLNQCIEAAFKNGFLKAMFEVFMETDDQDYCMQLAQALLLSTTFTVEGDAPEQSDIIVCGDGDSVWECLQKKNIARIRELIKAGHDVNIPNAAGRSLLQECIKQGIAHVIPDLCTSSTQLDINQPDSAGRTALFYSLTSPYTFRMEDKDVSVFEYLVGQGANVNVSDLFGRTVLHEWQPVSDGTRCGPSLQTLTHHIDINSADCKGQTALHIAMLNTNIHKVRQLVEHGGDLEACDINGITPMFLAERNESMLQVVHKYHPNCTLGTKESASDKDDSKQCVHMLKDKSKQHRLVPELKKVYRERMTSTQTENFASKYAERVYYIMQASIHEEKLTFENTIIHMLREINAMVVQEEPILSFIPCLSGSCAEGTKVIAMDEADMLCVFDHDFWRHLTLSPVVNDSRIHDNPSFVQITSLSTEYQGLFSENGVISKQKLLHRLYSLIRKALPVVLKSFRSLYMIDVKNTVANDHSLACLSMIWHGQHLPWQEFTVDVVPAIPVTQEQLPDVIRQVMSHSHIIQDLFVVPKTGTFDQSQNDAAFRLSFSSTERDLFLAMPATLKQGYMLTKVLVHDCVIVDNIHPGVCSYNLKTATFECFKTNVPNWDTTVTCARKTDKADETPSSAEDVVQQAQNILGRLEKNFAQKYQSSFFLPRCDLMVHSIDKNDYRQMLYVKYCLAVLSDTDDAAWQNLADYVAEQLLLSENLHERSFLQEIEILLDMGLKSLKNSVLCAMIKAGQVAGVKMLLERGASAGDIGDTSALLLAQTHRARDVYNFLGDTIKGICVCRNS